MVIFTHAFYDLLKSSLIGKGHSPEIADFIGKQIYGYSFISTNDPILHDYPNKTAIGCIQLGELRKFEQLPLSDRLTHHVTKQFRLYQNGDKFYLLRMRFRKPGGIKFSPGERMQSGITCQKAYRMNALQIAQWLDDRGERHPPQVKQILRCQVNGCDLDNQPRRVANNDTIIYHGERQYSTGESDLFQVTENEDTVLQSFLEQPAMDGPELKERAGFDEAPRVLRDLRKKYKGVFKPAIKCPKTRGNGGYHVAIRLNPSQ